MGLNLEYFGGQTPLDEDEKADLLIPTIMNRGELDEFEQKNTVSFQYIVSLTAMGGTVV